MTENEERILIVYRNAMTEIRLRLQNLEAIVNQETGLRARFAREAAYLNLRMICELIALGCAVAHEGLSDLAAPKLKKAYAADEIVNTLSHIHDRFYPHPIKIVSKQGNRVQIEDNNHKYLTKDDLKALYRKCGGILHRGNPLKMLNGEAIEKEWIAYVMHQGQMITNLLDNHILVMRDDQRSIFCNLSSLQVSLNNAV